MASIYRSDHIGASDFSTAQEELTEAQQLAYSWGVSSYPAKSPINELLRVLRKKEWTESVSSTPSHVLDKCWSRGVYSLAPTSTSSSSSDSDISVWMSLPNSGQMAVVEVRLSASFGRAMANTLREDSVSTSAVGQAQSIIQSASPVVTSSALWGPLLLFRDGVGIALRATVDSSMQSSQLQFSRKQESEASSRLSILTNCLQEMHTPSIRLGPMLRAVESHVRSLPGTVTAVISCVDVSEGVVLYGPDVDTTSSTMHHSSKNRKNVSISFANTVSESTHNMNTSGDSGKLNVDSLTAGHESRVSASLGNKVEGESRSSWDFSFREYEIEGVLSVITNDVLNSGDRIMLTALAKAVGRRVYELYRGTRNKKAFVEVQRDLEIAK